MFVAFCLYRLGPPEPPYLPRLILTLPCGISGVAGGVAGYMAGALAAGVFLILDRYLVTPREEDAAVHTTDMDGI